MPQPVPTPIKDENTKNLLQTPLTKTEFTQATYFLTVQKQPSDSKIQDCPTHTKFTAQPEEEKDEAPLNKRRKAKAQAKKDKKVKKNAPAPNIVDDKAKV